MRSQVLRSYSIRNLLLHIGLFDKVRIIIRMMSSAETETSKTPAESRRTPEKTPRSPGKKQWPNIFIAIPVNNPEIHIRVREVQRRFIDAVPLAERYMESTKKHHLTLCLSSVDEDRIQELSSHFEGKIREIVSSPTISNFENTELHVRGIGHFESQNVIFCKLSAVGFVFDELFHKLNILLETLDCPVMHRPEFAAHMTVFKVRGKPRFTTKDWKNLRKVYRQIEKENIDFGVQPVREIELLHMTLPKDQNGYYAKLASSMEEKSVLEKETFDELHRDCCVLPLKRCDGQRS